MRGMILLAFGAILIWVGIITRPDKSGVEDQQQASAAIGVGLERDGVGSDVLMQGDSEREEERVPEVVDPPVPADDEPPAARPADLPTPESEEAGPAEPDPGPAALGTRRAPKMPPPVRVAPVDEEPTFQLGGPLGDPGEAGEVLIEAWTQQDPGRLERFLNEGSGKDLPATRRRLIVAFWQSMVGDAEPGIEAVTDLEGAEGITTAQIGLLRASAEGAQAGVSGGSDAARAVPADIGRRDALARAMRMVLLDQIGDDARRAGAYAIAAQAYSDVIQLELGAPWAPHRDVLLGWAAVVNEVQEYHRLDPRGDWPSIEHEVKPNENLITIRKNILREHPGLRLSAGLLRKVNRVGKWIHPEDVLRIPTETPNVLVDLDARVALYRHGTEVVHAWEVGIGKEGHDTPTGTFVVGEKQTEPSWMPQGGPSLPYGHPDNPLGTRWVAWFRDGEKTSFGFHGTADPAGVGGRVSQGCIRMRNEDVEVLYELLPLGSRIIVQP